MSVSKAALSSKTGLFLTPVLMMILFCAITNVPNRVFNEQAQRDKTETRIRTSKSNKHHKYNRGLPDENTDKHNHKHQTANKILTIEANMEFSGSNIEERRSKKSNLTEDESNGSSAAKKMSKTGQLQRHKGSNFGLHTRAMSEKVTSDATPEEAGNKEQAQPNNLHTGYYGNGIHADKQDSHHPYENLYQNFRNFLETVRKYAYNFCHFLL